MQNRKKILNVLFSEQSSEFLEYTTGASVFFLNFFRIFLKNIATNPIQIIVAMLAAQVVLVEAEKKPWHKKAIGAVVNTPGKIAKETLRQTTETIKNTGQAMATAGKQLAQGKPDKAAKTIGTELLHQTSEIIEDVTKVPVTVLKSTIETIEGTAQVLVDAGEQFAKGKIDDAFETTVTGFYHEAIEALSVVHAFTPEFAKEIINQVGVTFVPLPGGKCGPANDRLKTWMIPDYLAFPTAQINFSQFCELHDQCYDACQPKAECDTKFGDGLNQECASKLSGNAEKICFAVASTYFKAVKDSQEAKDSYQRVCGSR